MRARVTWAIRAWPWAAAKGRPTKGLALPQQRGDAIAGREVFRSETFRNEGFWTEAVQLPQGIAAAKVTPLQTLDLGLQIDADMVDAATKAQLGAAWRNFYSRSDGQVQDTPGNFFDNKWAVVNASLRGEKRGVAMPLLLDLARKPVFLHDNSVPSLNVLLSPARGAKAPHPFYVRNPKQRSAVVTYLMALDTNSR